MVSLWRGRIDVRSITAVWIGAERAGIEGRLIEAQKIEMR
jgi:hypothetical protein